MHFEQNETSNSPYKSSKYLSLEWIQWELQQKDRKYKKVLWRGYRVEEYNNWTEKCNWGVQQQTRLCRRMDRRPGRQGRGIHSNRRKEKNFKKWR